MSDFRQYLYPHDHPRLAEVRGMDPYAYRDHARTPGTFTGGLVEGWTPLHRRPFRGITEDGVLREGLYPLEPARAGEEAPMAAMVDAAGTLLDLLGEDDRARVQHTVDAVEWQTWANPEFMQFDTGLRLEFQPAAVREAALALVAASLSPEGFAQVQLMMRINGFLGDVVGLPEVLGEFSYNVALYGEPDLRGPWGWQLFGHHCAVNCLVVEGRMVLSPVFLGAEPDAIDEGPHTSPRAFAGRIAQWRAVMAAMTPEQRASATVYAQMVDPAMPPGRVHPGDERHLGGAFQDNRVIPVEGVRVADLPDAAQAAARAVAATAVGLLPAGPRVARLREVDEQWAQTTFSWIGGHGPEDVFYARLQSPVLVAELDHHCGVFLDYDTPQPFHVHTVLRTPHGNDYGRAWVRQWQEQR
ncbi:DUF3500 domain-containing protein [Klenkia sp. PcliD-1-E]|uniref:DUF3500 domain-containing protein n=1 Tax=Klenkia sp. PcliD-1-E TaxID=2954492 RepID=UPI00209761D1|nr:DUF3500 domain-containing protein [Klenkia sp. PcliD-1-E]MCO7220906.1 DUF3500 domain-containing protein [Klenkia sp. PcliD-1-E]